MTRVILIATLLLSIAYSCVAQAAPPAAQTVKEGGQIFRRWCEECHGPGPLPGTSALERRYQGAVPAALEQRRDLSDALIRFVVRNGRSFMPFFRKTEISDSELAALSAYLTSDHELRTGAKDPLSK